MCGIAGILSANTAKISDERLKKMTAVLAHRGPDDDRTWTSASGLAGLGHRRLSIIDLTSAGDQPMHYLDRYTIVHNGEIYNYPELRSLLQSKGYIFHSKTDTEVILAAYAHFGHDCVQHFDGMFAFAIWDEQEKTLFVARDRFGEKPLFIYRDAEQFLFASEMKALWAAGAPKKSNGRMLFNFLTLGYTQSPMDSTETFFEDIFKMPARAFLVYRPLDDALAVTPYWDIEVAHTQQIGEQEAVETFRGLFDTSVARRLRSDVRLGTSLSGGLDSSSVVASILSGSDAPASLPTFSAVFPGFEKDESAYVRLLAGQFPLEDHPITPTAADLIRDLERLAWHQEEPFLSASIYAQFQVYGLAAAQGIKVLLDGQGADEVLAGYSKYYSRFWQELYRNDKEALAPELAAARNAGITQPWTWKQRLAAKSPSFAAMYLRRQRKAQQRRDSDLAREFVQESGKSYYMLPHIEGLGGALYYNTFMNGLEELLRYADRNAMAHGVETRLPFLSHELVEFVFSLPSNFKIRQAWTKWLLRKSMEERLPPAIVWRRDKVGYEPPQRLWMQDPMLQEYIHEARRKLVKAHILAPGVLDKKIQPQNAHAAENCDWRYLATAACMGD
jgi:asparagine synthase (glutamine-hydrolysing)